MRWSIIRLIWLRELRDQLRDRRTLFMVAILPLLLYPVLGFAVLQFAVGFSEKGNIVGLVRGPDSNRDFPPRPSSGEGRSVVPGAALLTAIPSGAGGVEQLLGAAALSGHGQRTLDYPPLVRDGVFTAAQSVLRAIDPSAFDPSKLLEDEPTAQLLQAFQRLKTSFLDEEDLKLLDDRKIDLLVTVPADFWAKLQQAESGADPSMPAVQVRIRANDDYSRQAKKRFDVLLDQWKKDLKKVRLARRGLPLEFDSPFEVKELGARPASPTTQRLLDLVTRLFPFMLVMWSLAGALYPAVDLCAGEKERGTMETLLITPAGREEIVLGKFLTIWVFSFASALLNLLSMGITTWQFGARLPQGEMPVGAIFWCLLLALPMSALFSAVSLAIGAYARSSKEGQYYLMPLFLITMPLIFLTMAPGVELNPFYSLVPVTGVALLMQKLMTATDLSQVWLYFAPVLLAIALYSWLALRWAISQFQREDVLFREAERLDIRLWLWRLFREKEPTPTHGQALFCFAVILGLRWLSLGLGQHMPVAMNTAIHLLALVGPPAVLMALLLNTQPRDALRLHAPAGRDLVLAAGLALLLVPVAVAGAQIVFAQSEQLTRQLLDRQPLFEELHSLHKGESLRTDQIGAFLLAFALLPAVCEELAFRGYILTGLLKRFRPRSAIVVSAFLFGLYHMNVFQFVPAFCLGIVLGLITVRSRSLAPAMMMHFLHNALLLLGIHLTRAGQDVIPSQVALVWPYAIGICLITAAVLVWRLYRKPYVEQQP